MDILLARGKKTVLEEDKRRIHKRHHHSTRKSPIDARDICPLWIRSKRHVMRHRATSQACKYMDFQNIRHCDTYFSMYVRRCLYVLQQEEKESKRRPSPYVL